jgi:hypothetical protein
LKGSGGVSEDKFQIKLVSNLNQLTTLVGDEVKIYLAAHSKTGNEFNNYGIGIATQLWGIGDQKYTDDYLANLLGNSYGDIYGCGATNVYANQILSKFTPEIMGYLYE